MNIAATKNSSKIHEILQTFMFTENNILHDIFFDCDDEAKPINVSFAKQFDLNSKFTQL